MINFFIHIVTLITATTTAAPATTTATPDPQYVDCLVTIESSPLRRDGSTATSFYGIDPREESPCEDWECCQKHCESDELCRVWSWFTGCLKSKDISSHLSNEPLELYPGNEHIISGTNRWNNPVPFKVPEAYCVVKSNVEKDLPSCDDPDQMTTKKWLCKKGGAFQSEIYGDYYNYVSEDDWKLCAATCRAFDWCETWAFTEMPEWRGYSYSHCTYWKKRDPSSVGWYERSSTYSPVGGYEYEHRTCFTTVTLGKKCNPGIREGLEGKGNFYWWDWNDPDEGDYSNEPEGCVSTYE